MLQKSIKNVAKNATKSEKKCNLIKKVDVDQQLEEKKLRDVLDFRS
jgi:hypothetical protein